MSAFSFYPTKVLGAFGDGGMIMTNSPRLALKARMLRMYGIKREYYSEFPGYNSRLDELHAAILRHKLQKLAPAIKKRQALAKQYYANLKGTPLALPIPDPKATHAYHLFVVRHKKREAILRFMETHGITLSVSYRHPLHLMRGFRFLGYKKGDFPVAEETVREIFSLPLYPGLRLRDQKKIIKTLKQFDWD